MNTLPKNFGYLLMIAILGLSACSSGGGSSDPDVGDGGDPIDDGDPVGGDDPTDDTAYSTPSSTVSGVVVDGYIRNAFVCVDLDRDNECGDGEPYTKADGKGAYDIDISELSASQIASAQIIAEGGTDNDTGQRYTGLLKAPLFTDSEGTINLSPLNTLLATQLAIAKESLSESVVNSYKDDLQEQLGLADGSDVQSDPKKNSNIYDASIQVQEGIEMYAEALRVEIDSLGEAAAFDSAMEALAAELIDNGSNGSSVSSLSTTRIKANSDTAASDDVIANVFAGIESVTVDGETVNMPEQLRADLVSAVAEIGTELANAETASDASLALSLLVAMVDAIKETIAGSDSLDDVESDDLVTEVEIPQSKEELDKAEIKRLFDLIGANSDELGDDYSKYIDEVFDLDNGNEIAGDTSVDSFADLIDGWIANLAAEDTTAEQEEQLEILDTLQAYINGTLIETSSEYLAISDVTAGGIYLLESKYDDGISFSHYNQLGFLSIFLRGDRFDEDSTNPGSGRLLSVETIFNPEGEGSFKIVDTDANLSTTDSVSDYVLSTDKGWVPLVMKENIIDASYQNDIYYNTSDDGQRMILSYKDIYGNFYPYAEAAFGAIEIAGKTRVFDVINDTSHKVLGELETISHTFDGGHELLIDVTFDPVMILSDHAAIISFDSGAEDGGSSDVSLESYLISCNGTLKSLEQEDITTYDVSDLYYGCGPFYLESEESLGVFDSYDTASKSGKIYAVSLDADSMKILSSQIGTYVVETLSGSANIQFTDIDWWQAVDDDAWLQASLVASDGKEIRLAFNLDLYSFDDDTEYYYDEVAANDLLNANIAKFDQLFEESPTSIQINISNTKLVSDDECQIPESIYMRIDGRADSASTLAYVFSTLNEEIIAVGYDKDTGYITIDETELNNQAVVYFAKDIPTPNTYYAELYGYVGDWSPIETNRVQLTQSGSDNNIQLQLAGAEFEFWCY